MGEPAEFRFFRLGASKAILLAICWRSPAMNWKNSPRWRLHCPRMKKRRGSDRDAGRRDYRDRPTAIMVPPVTAAAGSWNLTCAERIQP